MTVNNEENDRPAETKRSADVRKGDLPRRPPAEGADDAPPPYKGSPRRQ
ncbi:MAG TPA: hypothetical protein VNZ43_16230 [Sphingomonadaceae bacterium]|jgi:hypothetical protein|nr:hypothetical protein [Sphingomonadaceae bacterium]